MNKVRRDVVFHELRALRLRMALLVVLLPEGWAISKGPPDLTYTYPPVPRRKRVP